MSSSNTRRLLVSSGNGPGECQQAVSHIIQALQDECERRDIDLDVSERSGAQGPSSAVVVLKGDAADTMVKDWVGPILWRCQSDLRPRHRRKNWFAQVFELPLTAHSIAIDEREIEMTAMRAGGPGGQHQNKTSSAIRAKWKHPSGKEYSVVVRSDRSQHRNRKIAIERLQELIAADLSEAEEAQKGDAHKLHHRLQRGDPRKIFEGPGFKPVVKFKAY